MFRTGKRGAGDRPFYGLRHSKVTVPVCSILNRYSSYLKQRSKKLI